MDFAAVRTNYNACLLVVAAIREREPLSLKLSFEWI